MPHLAGTTWRTHALIIHIHGVDPTHYGAELSIVTEPPSGNLASLDDFWTWVDAAHAECDNGVYPMEETATLV